MTKAAIPCFAHGTPVARLYSIRLQTQTVDKRGSDLDFTIMHGILQGLAQCAPLRGYEMNTQQTWSVTLLPPVA